ncbi:MAG: hypothetical protein M1834_005406 [Cirrosporium novae-zelandiae]|nr:MAG: hypothetical protein M1834_005406 [Cirrosporium novae-zelandiae]
MTTSACITEKIRDTDIPIDKEVDSTTEITPISYTLFSRGQRIIIISLVSFTGLLSPLSSTLYTPAIPKIAKELNVSISAVNSTITSYLIFQGITPTIWGSIGDSLGRRRLYVTTLSVYVAACIGLSISNSYAAVLVLRALQATGSAPVSALGAGIIADIIHISERGKFVGMYSALGGLGTAFGPVLGGIFAQYTGWHGIFFFLLALSAATLILLVLVLPETLRSIVGNGSTIPSRYLQPPLPCLRPPISHQPSPLPPKRKVDLLGTFRVMKEPDIICSLVFTGICFTVWQMCMVATSTLYAERYELNELKIGLTYISNGIGSLCASITTGKILDYDYKRQLRRESADMSMVSDKVVMIERARIRSLRIPTPLFIASTIAFGWVIQSHCHISISIILSFFVGGFDTCILATFSTLIIDLFENQSSTATASLNLIRCLFAAGGASAIQPLIECVDVGWAFTILGFICILASPTVLAEYRYGSQWRAKRQRRIDASQGWGTGSSMGAL